MFFDSMAIWKDANEAHIANAVHMTVLLSDVAPRRNVFMNWIWRLLHIIREKYARFSWHGMGLFGYYRCFAAFATRSDSNWISKEVKPHLL